MSSFRTLLLLTTTATCAVAFSNTRSALLPAVSNKKCSSKFPSQRHSTATASEVEVPAQAQEQKRKDRPLLRQFGQGITARIMDSKEGCNQFGLTEDHYTSGEMIPCLNMQCDDGELASDDDVSGYGIGGGDVDLRNNASRRAIRRAYTESSESSNKSQDQRKGEHGRSSGSGCSVIRLRGEDAASIRGLVNFADNFFEGVDDDECNTPINELGVFRVANNVHCGFDTNVNEEGKMQVLYTKMIPGETKSDDPTLLPMEVGDLVGTQSLGRAHKGMNTLFDIGSQITSAVLGMDRLSTTKLLDDCSSSSSSDQSAMAADNVSNSYQRLIRYLKPQQSNNPEDGETKTDADAAFWPHVDSTFLTLIPMPELPGLEVWCPSKNDAENCDLGQGGEWVRPIADVDDGEEEDCAYVIALAGEFLQLLSDGRVPTCIHRVIPPQHTAPTSLTSSPAGNYGFGPKGKYKPRISAPLFVRPRRKDDATLDVSSDLKKFENVGWEGCEFDSTTATITPGRGLYFEEGLMEECDEMKIW
eukprot:CAMPEP_0201677938 /NCGR_PEP_ID=MMETSP0494-20130426/45165_1 /ASSEMBLY_ACC=CAM_ASM_000839 /TAXON_ID=420259 /ORGANISM="Thalassiosira gravida, Strain GMp14c1" /LENGTH=529 /DNA_ID=CAMNT_0048160999 /DNA_START=199 /DNA_END=1785 /DNA_ORIENTATION=-